MLALQPHIAWVVDVVHHHITTIAVERDFGAEEIEMGDTGNDAGDAGEFVAVHELHIAAGKRVLRPVRRGGSASGS